MMDQQGLNLLTSATTLLWEICGKEIAIDIARHVAGEFGTWAKLRGKKAGAAVAVRVWEQVNWRHAAAKYNAKLQRLYGTTTVLGKSDPIDLKSIFTDVFILDQPTALRRFDIERLQQDPQLLDRNHSRIEGVSLVQQKANTRLFILGKPGAGKTTFLKHLVLQAALGRFKKIPIFVSLKEWSDSHKNLMSFISMQFDICDFPAADKFLTKILENGVALVLFDGLDEVKQDERRSVIPELHQFTSKYINSQCVITCRRAAENYRFDHFKYMEVADFTDEQVQVYVHRWFDDETRTAKFFEEFHRPHNKRLTELARTPLLLGLLCLAFEATLAFPKRRVEVYEDAVEALLRKWDASRGVQRDEIYRDLSPGRKRQMFARIGAKTFQAAQYFMSESQLAGEIVDHLSRLPNETRREDIDGVAVLKAIEAQHGIICERAKQIYSFAHLTFQEYFAARYIVEDTSGRARHGLMTAANVIDPRWREVILLAASLLEDADEYMNEFLLAIDDIVGKDDEIWRFVASLHAKTSRLPSSGDNVRARSFYWCLSFNLVYRDVVCGSSVYTLDLNMLRARMAGEVGLAAKIDADDDSATRLYRARAFAFDLADSLDPQLVRKIDMSSPPRGLATRFPSRVKQADLAIRPVDVGGGIHRDLERLISQAGAITREYEGAAEREMQIDLHLCCLLSDAICWRWWPPTNEDAREYGDVIRGQAHEAGLTDLENQLAALQIPLSTSQRWKEFAEELTAVLLERIVPSLPRLNQRQCDKLSAYFSASLLFLEALELAAVSDRSGLREGLVILPERRRLCPQRGS